MREATSDRGGSVFCDSGSWAAPEFLFVLKICVAVPADKARYRILYSFPPFQYLIDQDARIVLCSHLGRPQGGVNKSLRLDPLAQRLSELLKKEVKKVDDCIGPDVEAAVKNLSPKEVLLLENTILRGRAIKKTRKKKNGPSPAAYGGAPAIEERGKF